MVQTRSSSTRTLAAPSTPGGPLSPRKRGPDKGQTEEDLVKAIARRAELDAQREQALELANGGHGGKYQPGPKSFHYECEPPLGPELYGQSR